MSDFVTTALSEEDMRAYAARHGLTNLPPDQIARMRGLAVRVAQTGGNLARMPEKSDEPAFTFAPPRL
ncbi:hypothetical protein [Acidisphaera sp. L21]|uniref:hypothetical protein n=1 Tax=Acidisphaera sp. L21 TaxID=1641851 RepID=UPI00131C8910|nr:hypothetical protein [Acidisphaera sp. L21]